MKIGRPKVAKLNTGSASNGAYGQGGAGLAGQVKSGHHFHAVKAGGAGPGFARQSNARVNSGHTDARKKSGKMF